MIAAIEKYGIPVTTWVRFEGDLDFFFGSGSIDWEWCGFSVPLIKEAVKMGFQWTNEDGNLISIFPVSNEDAFNAAFNDKLLTYPGLCRCITEDAALDEYNAHKAIMEAEAAVMENTPSQEDIYKAQQLLLLTKIANKLGDING